MARRSETIVRCIAVLKLVKAAVLLAAAVVALVVPHGHTEWLLHLQPGHASVNHAIAKLCALSPQKGELVALGLSVYAALFVVEGVGLLRKKLWAEYLTVIITASFVPLEIYEIAKQVSAVRVAAFVVNIAIVVYLVLRLRSDHHWPFRSRAKRLLGRWL